MIYCINGVNMDMKKTVLLYSKNKKYIEKISRILENENYDLKTERTIKDLPLQADTAAFLIIDITDLSDVDYTYLKELNTDTGYNNIVSLAVLDPSRIKSLTESEVRFDDFVLYAQLEKELTTRLKLIALKKKTFPPKNSIVVKGLVLNLDKYELSVDQKPVELTFKEFELLKLLLQHQDKVLSRNKLLSAVWEYDFYGGSRTVDVHMRRLRSKIPPPYNLMLKTIRNVGYMFSLQI